MATRAEIMEKLGEVQHMLNIARHNRKEQEAATDANVARVLALLRLKSEISVEEMSTVLGISPDSLGTTLGNMANDGLVVVTKDEDDNVQSVTLGEKGQEEQPKPRDLQNVALDGFTDDEVDTLGAFLDRIANPDAVEVEAPTEDMHALEDANAANVLNALEDLDIHFIGESGT